MDKAHRQVRTVASSEYSLFIQPVHSTLHYIQILDAMLESSRWSKLGSAWDSDRREALVKAWHKANGALAIDIAYHWLRAS